MNDEIKARRELKLWLALAAILVAALGADALAGAIKTWTTGEALNSADLNSNFQHIHNNMVGGHGARLKNSDVSASAAIAHSKLASPGLVPKAWGVVSACTSSPCTLQANSSNISSVTRTSVGLYVVNISPVRANANYNVTVTDMGGVKFRSCQVQNYGTSSFEVVCGHVTRGNCTAVSGTPSQCTATVTALSDCACTPVTTAAATAAQGCGASLTSTTLTLTTANTVSTILNYVCSGLTDTGFSFTLMDDDN